jgi:hypothetical protein
MTMRSIFFAMWLTVLAVSPGAGQEEQAGFQVFAYGVRLQEPYEFSTLFLKGHPFYPTRGGWAYQSTPETEASSMEASSVLETVMLAVADQGTGWVIVFGGSELLDGSGHRIGLGHRRLRQPAADAEHLRLRVVHPAGGRGGDLGRDEGAVPIGEAPGAAPRFVPLPERCREPEFQGEKGGEVATNDSGGWIHRATRVP